MRHHLRHLLPLLVTLGGVAACGTSSTSNGSGADGGGPACAQGTKLTTLPACTSPVTSSVTVPSGCAPAVDGTYTQGEWGDAVCVTVGMDPVYLKYSGTYLYLAWPMSRNCTGTPTATCPAQLAFNTDGAVGLDGNQIDLNVADVPANSSGDSGESLSDMGTWDPSPTVETDIVIADTAGASSPATYEFAIPLARLGIAPGQLDNVGLALSHLPTDVWPSGVTVDTDNGQPNNPGNWGVISSPDKWK